MMTKMNPRIVEITERIRERSRDSRQAYLEMIDQTIVSVLSQAGPFELHYHIQDGGSTDDTVERLRQWSDRINSGQHTSFCEAIHFSYESDPDAGMYDAIRRGFESFDLANEDWLTWINSDDILAPGACALMALIDGDEQSDSISWVSGTAAIIRNGTVVSNAQRLVSSEVAKLGICDGHHWEFLQQEGTFFRAKLWRTIDPTLDFANFRLAGDWNLWRLFAHEADRSTTALNPQLPRMKKYEKLHFCRRRSISKHVKCMRLR